LKTLLPAGKALEEGQQADNGTHSSHNKTCDQSCILGARWSNRWACRAVYVSVTLLRFELCGMLQNLPVWEQRWQISKPPHVLIL
jgi:hypothetical protein